MKNRILKTLESFSDPKILEAVSPIFQKLCAMIEGSPEALHQKASRVFQNILQDYSSFDVVTIDNFTHRVIRTFAKDLKIPQHFQVELNTTEVLEQAVDRVIDKIGLDQEVTDALLAFALEKIDEDRSWDIAYDLNNIARLLLNEDDQKFLELLRNKSLQDFVKLKIILDNRVRARTAQITTEAVRLLDHLDKLGLKDHHFSGKYLPTRLKQYAEGNISADLKTKWLQNIADQPLYKKAEKPDIKAVLDREQVHIAGVFASIKSSIYKIQLENNLLKRLVPLSVLQIIDSEVQALKREKNLLLISDFNHVIQKHIVKEPTPFIYERLGERYRHYFIDEFQDTSVLQWANLVPLIDNALSTETNDGIANSLMVVGDPKQAIYRWRGGDAKQFIELASDGNSTFSNPSKRTVQLPKNFRSYDTIVEFNNSFFQYCSAFLSNSDYAEAFRLGNQQETNNKRGGHVSISFVDEEDTTDLADLYLKEVLAAARQSNENGFGWGEICVLVRKNAQGVAVANFLQEQGIQVVSSQSLLLSKSAGIRLILNVLRLLQNPQDSLSAFEILNFVADQGVDAMDRHRFFRENLNFKDAKFFDNLERVGINFKSQYCLHLPLYEKVEYIARAFALYEQGGAHLQFLLDHAHSYAQKHTDGTYGFLQWFDKNEDNLSISTPENLDAVKIMTIHKAKGLEFPVVIYPFADDSFYNSLDHLHWYRTDPLEYNGFEVLLLGQHKQLEAISDSTAELYAGKRNFQELDKFNELYVALTRPVEQLHIITRSPKSSADGLPKKFSELFKGYLVDIGRWDQNQKKYEIPKDQDPSRGLRADGNTVKAEVLHLFSSDRKSHNLQIVTHPLYEESERETARLRGNLLHELFANIIYANDINTAVNDFVQRGLIKSEESSVYRSKVEQTVEMLSADGYFSPLHEVYNERDLLYNNSTFRPDRIELVDGKKAFLLDYKTGKPELVHKRQLEQYATVLREMGFEVIRQRLCYLNPKNT